MGWDEVGANVRRVRHLRRQTQREFGNEIGLSERIISAVEAGEDRRYDETTVHRIESALGWAPGSVERVLGGRRPVVVADPVLARILDAWPRLPAGTRRMLAAAAGNALGGYDDPTD